MVLDDEKKKEIGKRTQKTRKELGFKNGHAFYDFVFGDGEIKTDNKKDSVISEWENGKKYIDLDHLMLVADKLGVSLDYLVYGKGEEEHAPTLREICKWLAYFFFAFNIKIEKVENGIRFFLKNERLYRVPVLLNDQIASRKCLIHWDRNRVMVINFLEVLKSVSHLSLNRKIKGDNINNPYTNCPVSIKEYSIGMFPDYNETFAYICKENRLSSYLNDIPDKTLEKLLVEQCEAIIEEVALKSKSPSE